MTVVRLIDRGELTVQGGGIHRRNAASELVRYQAASAARLAETGLFQLLWSEQILDEVQRNLPKVGVTAEQASGRVATMRDAFGAEPMIRQVT